MKGYRSHAETLADLLEQLLQGPDLTRPVSEHLELEEQARRAVAEYREAAEA